MKILIEGEFYDVSVLESVFDDPKFYYQKDNQGVINYVGYYHSFEKKELIYMLPKVFMKTQKETIFGVTPIELFNFEKNESFKHSHDYKWIRQLLIYFYNSLIEYKKRSVNSNLINTQETFELNTNLGDNEYTFLDLLLTFVNFYKKNKNTILYKHIEYNSNHVKKAKWDKTIRSNLPIITSQNTPIYLEIKNKKKVVNTEEELITYFFSILNHFNTEFKFHLKIDPSYPFLKGSKFELLQKTGLAKLRKIKHRYFSDTLKRMYVLCEIYFTHSDQSSIKKKKDEFITVKNYNLIFEDMIDKLFSEKFNDVKVDNISLNDLKYNMDGKIIDHIYESKSLIDNSNIFYIGDSKYYKSDSEAGKGSRFKQFSYAKNVIQFNIDLLNKRGVKYSKNLRYRDEITEGYNITPNFFVYGYIDDYQNYTDSNIQKQGNPILSYHFKNRLFDRDTLFVHQYKINFLFVLKSYSTFNDSEIQSFREMNRSLFRNEFVNFFNSHDSKFEIYQKKMSEVEATELMNKHFRLLNGKSFYTNDGSLLIAKGLDDDNLSLELINKENFHKKILT